MGNRRLLGVLLVLFVAVLIWNILSFSGFLGSGNGAQDDGIVRGPALFPNDQLRPTRVAPRAGGVDQEQWVEPRGVVAANEIGLGTNWGRNPFFTPSEIWALDNYRPIRIEEPFVPPDDLFLHAVVRDSTGRRMAILNNDIVAVGDIYAGMEIVDMVDDGVVFLVDGQRHLVRIGEAELNLRVRGFASGRY